MSRFHNASSSILIVFSKFRLIFPIIRSVKVPIFKTTAGADVENTCHHLLHLHAPKERKKDNCLEQEMEASTVVALTSNINIRCCSIIF
jgi:hypothetical protein